MRQQKYVARKGARINDKDAAIIGTALDELGPRCSAEAVVSAAKKKTSPLHGYFEWNNDRAALLHRLEQARYYMRMIEVVIVTEGRDETTRAWHHVNISQKDGSQGFYTSVLEIRKDSDLSGQVIEHALRELQGWKSRYKQYQSIFGEVFEAIDKTIRNTSRRRAVA